MFINHDVAGSSPAGGARKKDLSIDKSFFNEINPLRICEIPFGREILLRNVKYACGV